MLVLIGDPPPILQGVGLGTPIQTKLNIYTKAWYVHR